MKKNIGQVQPDNKSCSCPLCGESTAKRGKGVLTFNNPPSALQATSSAREEVNCGFTLLEVLVVVLIIGILAAVALPQYQFAVAKSRVMRMLSIMHEIDAAQQLYFLTNGAYTNNFSLLDIQFPVSQGSVVADEWKCVMNGFAQNNYAPRIYCTSGNSADPALEKYLKEKEGRCWPGSKTRAQKICRSLPNARVDGLYYFSL